ncbi:histidine kinase [Rhodoblastus sphagnicola]|uniref:histidine kinase n=1 Tax=Rhodoblastus sphagnicola TaxID=333368 RepID=A0A2S6MTW5_9HYPH|nr:histidine kinase [Rhodoblastus sphagnicola]
MGSRCSAAPIPNRRKPRLDNAAEVKRLLRQQAAVASFGSFALRQTDLQKVLTEAARVCAEGLSVKFCKVCQYRPDTEDLLIVAGCGWKTGVVGHVVSRADISSPQGRAFVTGEPSICNDLRGDRQFKLPSFYAEHGIVSTIDVLIKGVLRPFGVLEIDSDQQQTYDQQDVIFLTGFANVLAEAVATADRTAVLRTTIAQMKLLVEDKDRLLEQKKVLAEELQHRVRNNLQLIYGMLTRQLDETSDAGGQRGIKAIARRVSTLAQVYDHLLGAEMTRTTDFGTYVKSLCANLGEIQASPAKVTLTCDSDVVILDLDVVTALGIVVAELVTNSYDHAFPNGAGTIDVSVRRDPDNGAMATMIIKDDGQGFEVKTGSKRHGLGLVRRLAEQVRGTADVASSGGATWTITFPVAEVAA